MAVNNKKGFLTKFPLERYPMKEKNIGNAYIFSNDTFEGSGYPKRKGNEFDVLALRQLFNKMGFFVEEEPLRNLTDTECLNKFDEIIAREDLCNDSCLMVAFLSHGDLNKIRMRKGSIDLQQIMERFMEDSCKHLLNKPKIFIFQACRGLKRDNFTRGDIEHDGGLISNEQSDKDDCEQEVVDGGESYMPKGADFIFCYPTSPGYCAYRNPNTGSFFIQELSEVFDAYMNDESDDEVDFVSLMTLVSRRVSERTANAGKGGKKQMPWFSSTLRKQLYFSKAIQQMKEDYPESDKSETSECVQSEEVETETRQSVQVETTELVDTETSQSVQQDSNHENDDTNLYQSGAPTSVEAEADNEYCAIDSPTLDETKPEESNDLNKQRSDQEDI